MNGHPPEVRAVIDAWNVPGVMPIAHITAKAKLREGWSALAHALDNLTLFSTTTPVVSTASPRRRLMQELEALVNKYQAAPSTLLAELEDFVQDNE